MAFTASILPLFFILFLFFQGVIIEAVGTQEWYRQAPSLGTMLSTSASSLHRFQGCL